MNTVLWNTDSGSPLRGARNDILSPGGSRLRGRAGLSASPLSPIAKENRRRTQQSPSPIAEEGRGKRHHSDRRRPAGMPAGGRRSNPVFAQTRGSPLPKPGLRDKRLDLRRLRQLQPPRLRQRQTQQVARLGAIGIVPPPQQRDR